MVIAIFAILAAMLLPAFGKAKALEKAACASNLKQCSLAMIMYSNKNDGYIQLNTPDNNRDGHGLCWKRWNALHIVN